MRNINIILAELAKESQTSESDRRHFEFLSKLLPRRNYHALLQHLSKATEQIIYTSDYKATLRELSEHFKIKSKKNAEKRLLKLMTAIKNPHRPPAAVQDELDEGGAVVINDVYRSSDPEDKHSGLAPLMAAIAKKDKELIRLLLDNGANLDKVENINARFGDLNSTALHIAVELKMYDLIVMILESKPDLELKDKIGMTPLHIACDNDSRADIALLLINKGAKPDVAIKIIDKEITPFIMAITNNNIKLIRLMLDKGYRPTEFDLHTAKFSREKFDYNDEVYNLLKNPFRDKKNAIVRASRSSLFKTEDTTFAPIADVMFAEDPMLKAAIIKNLGEIYRDTSNPVMKPLLDLVLMGADAKHKSGLKAGKKLNIFITHNQSINDLRPDGEDHHGQYNNGNSVYVASQGGHVRNTLSTLLHELKHFADAQIYRDDKPYLGDSQEVLFRAIKNKLKANAEKFFAQPAESRNEIDHNIYSRIYSIFTSYQPEDQDVEVLVKVPEIIGYLGLKEGYDWLKKNEPPLLNFYEKYFNPACEAYLTRQAQVVDVPTQNQSNNFVK